MINLKSSFCPSGGAPNSNLMSISGPTHVSLILEGELAGGPPAVEVSSSLPIKTAAGFPTVFCGAESLEALLDDGRIFTMIVCVHLDI